jgi:hypothetical protein
VSEDLSKLTDRELALLILHEVRGVARSLEGLGQSVGRDVGAALQRLETLDQNVDLARRALHSLGGVVRGADFLAHDRVEQLESRVEAIERRPRVVGNGGE